MKNLASTLVAAAIAAALSTHADARVHLVPPSQTFSLESASSARNVAIYGQYAIAIIERAGGRKAVLFRHDVDHNTWAIDHTLLDVTTSDSSNDDLVMDNGVAAIRIGKDLHIFEYRVNTYVESGVAGTPQPAHGLVIDDHSILAARPGCAYDANLFEKSQSSGAWRVNGRITGQSSDCNPYTAMALGSGVALMRNSATQIGEYHRNGSFDWTLAGNITAPPGVTFQAEAPVLYSDLAITADGHYFQRSTGGTYLGRIQPLNSGNGPKPTDAKFHSLALLTLSSFGGLHDDTQPYLYMDDGHNGFNHVAILQTYGSVAYADSDYYQVITSEEEYGGTYNISFFTLPNGIVAPRAVANDFDARDVSGIQQTLGNGFALADAGGNYVYRQSDSSGENQAKFTDTVWNYAQFVEADVTPTAFDGSDGWAAVAVRYADRKNQYYLTLRSSNKLQLKKKVGGEYTTLAEERVTVTPGKKYHLRLGVVGSRLTASINGVGYLSAEDNSLTRGAAALMTNHASADFDNVYVAPTGSLGLANKPYSDLFTDQGEPFTTQGGSWTPIDNPDDARIAYSQTSTSGDTRAFIGTPTDDQRIDTTLRVDSWGSSTAGAWAGVLARWVDSKNYYYMTIRSTGRLEIRKQVNGTITTLKSVPFTATPGHFYALRFEVLGNELHAFVDGKYMAGAIDSDIAKGQYGLGSYRAAFTYQNFDAQQP